MKPIISVIIPVYNHAEILKDSLFSVYRQTHRPIEVIIVDDGSDDNVSGVLSRLDFDLKIKLIQQKNQGAPSARNRGFKKSKGEYVIFWDADTLAEPQMLTKMLYTLEKNPSASYAYSRFRFGWKKMRSHIFDPRLLRQQNYIDTTSLIRREEFFPFDEKLKRFQDWDLWLTLLQKNKTGVLVPEYLYKKVVSVGRAGSISRWLPSFFYKFPCCASATKDYKMAKELVQIKHGIFTK